MAWREDDEALVLVVEAIDTTPFTHGLIDLETGEIADIHAWCCNRSGL